MTTSTAVRAVISFIVPVRNDAGHLRRCLETIAANSSAIPSEVIVVDNGSTDGSGDVARAAGAFVLEVSDGRVADLRNQAGRIATGEYIAFVDADHELAPGWSEAALLLLQNDSVFAVGAPYHPPLDSTWVQRAYDRFRHHQSGSREVEWLGSGNLVVRRTVFERIGGFDATLETCEDVDLSWRLRVHGGRLIADDRLRSIHQGDPKTLKALFFGELWRGRDNLRVSLRAPITLRSLPSAIIPVINLLAFTAIVFGILTWGVGGWPFAAAGAAVFGALTLAHTGSLLSRGPSLGRVTGSAVQLFIVAGVYDVARALALVAHTGHGARRKV
jgi:GT2 family glycosyltransferase